MHRLVNKITAWLSRSSQFMFKDKAAIVEIRRKYSSMEWAQRNSSTYHDIEAADVNSSVYICVRAISDAIKGLPVSIVSKENVGGIERVIQESDHPANELLRKPNTEHTWSDIIDHVVKSYLLDGNAIMTIERSTGPNPYVEIWPRDPRSVDINVNTRKYRFGAYTAVKKEFPRDRVIHIRDMSVDDPFWGVGRVNTVRDEIMMDYFVNRFNSNFFKYGAVLNLMFTPDHDLTDDQHYQLLDAMSSDISGVDRMFKIFINKYAGKFEYPDQKHKDIAFLELLKHNREKIFGVFGLPPFRGGVMEYANYANALAQDADFWRNTIAPIIEVIASAFNKQLLWPTYGSDIGLSFDLDSVPAICGTQTEIEDRLLKLKDKGIVSAQYVREQLGLSEDAAPAETPAIAPVAAPDEDAEPAPTDEEQNKLQRAVFALLKEQRKQAAHDLSDITSAGALMCVLCDPGTQVGKIYNPIKAYKAARINIVPVLKDIVVDRGIRKLNGVGVFDIEHTLIKKLLCRATERLESAVDQNTALLRAILTDADRFGWSYYQTEKRVCGVFSYENAVSISTKLLNDFVKDATNVIAEMRYSSRLAVSRLQTKETIHTI